MMGHSMKTEQGNGLNSQVGVAWRRGLMLTHAMTEHQLDMIFQ